VKIEIKFLLILAFIFLFLAPIKISSAPPVAWDIKGLNYASWWNGQFEAPLSVQQIEAMHSTGANYAAVVTTWFMTNENSSSIWPDAQSHSFSEIRNVIRYLHQRGLHVMLKPHVDCKNGTFRGQITPNDVNAWFDSYRNFITNLAIICQEEGVEMYCVGTELDSMSGPSAYSNQWVTTVNKVRTLYSGPLVYTANWGRNIDSECYLYCKLWQLVDYAAVDAYFPIDDAQTPSIAQITAGWRNSAVPSMGCVGYDWVSDISNWQASHGKEIIFGEIGYSSRDYTAEDPWAIGGTYNAAAQSNALEGAFEVWQSKPWFRGAFLWSYYPDRTGGVGDTDHTPQNKPGENTVRKWYTASTVTIANPSVTPSLVTNNQPRVVRFNIDATSDNGTVTNAVIFLEKLGGPVQAVNMSNIGPSQYQYSYVIPAGQTADDYQITAVAYDDLGSSDWEFLSLIVISQSYLPSLVIYDGEGGETDFNYGWHWGNINFSDSTTSPQSGTYCGRIYMTNNVCGIAHIRDGSWSGINAYNADILELWVKGTEYLPVDRGMLIRLLAYDGAVYNSAPVEISLSPNWKKVDIPVTNLLNGADAGFSMSNVLGISFENTSGTAAGLEIFVDNIILTKPIIISNAKAYPEVIISTVGTNVNFYCKVSGINNITSATVDLSPLGAAFNKEQMIDQGAGLFSHIHFISAGGVPDGTYALPVVIHDSLGNKEVSQILITVASPAAAVLEIIYDGETEFTDANWENWWGTSTFVDQTSDVMFPIQSARFDSVGAHSGGVQIPTLAWWNGVDVSGADEFEFYFKAPNGNSVDVTLFSYDEASGMGVQYANPINVTGNNTWVQVVRDMSVLSNGLFDPEYLVGVQISADAGTTAYFDNMRFTANVVVKQEYAVPTLISNTTANVVQFWVKARTSNLFITNVYIDLSLFGGPAAAKMTNISGSTQFRYSYEVPVSQALGNYYVPVEAYDNAGFSGKGEVRLSVVGISPYSV